MQTFNEFGFEEYSFSEAKGQKKDFALDGLVGDDGLTRGFVEHDSMALQVEVLLKTAKFLLEMVQPIDTNDEEYEIREANLLKGIEFLRPYLFEQVPPHFEYIKSKNNEDKLRPDCGKVYDFKNDPNAKELFDLVSENWSFSIDWAKRATHFLKSNWGGRLKKRFMSEKGSEAELSVKRLKLLRKICENIKKREESLIDITVFGSTVRGGAKEESDLDGWLFYKSKISDFNEVVGRLGDVNEGELMYDTLDTESVSIRGALNVEFQNIGWGKEKAESLHTLPINETLVKQAVTHVILGDENLVPAQSYLEALFCLSLNNNLNEYRKLMLDELSKAGRVGEKTWIKFIKRLKSWELGFPERKLPNSFEDKRYYPMTLKDARDLWVRV